MQPPEIRYVKCAGRDLAYEVVGSGTAGFVVFLDIGAHLDKREARGTTPEPAGDAGPRPGCS